MKYTQPITMEYLKNGNWFLFGAMYALRSGNIHIVIASLSEIINFSLLSSISEELFCFKTIDISTFKKCDLISLSRSIIEVQIDKGVYKIVEFENEAEEARFCLLNEGYTHEIIS